MAGRVLSRSRAGILFGLKLLGLPSQASAFLAHLGLGASAPSHGGQLRLEIQVSPAI
jgi:hypothetical protein